MENFTKEELAKVARMSGLEISGQEADTLVKDLEQIIEYVDQIMSLERGNELEAYKSINVFREDKTYNEDSVNIDEVFQKKEEDYLSVPKVLD